MGFKWAFLTIRNQKYKKCAMFPQKFVIGYTLQKMPNISCPLPEKSTGICGWTWLEPWIKQFFDFLAKQFAAVKTITTLPSTNVLLRLSSVEKWNNKLKPQNVQNATDTTSLGLPFAHNSQVWDCFEVEIEGRLFRSFTVCFYTQVLLPCTDRKFFATFKV